ncbi:MAG: IS110 family transposase [Chloroflexi bacterium]|nr:MAG: IS110 family transposase [Chloroflexota bacterium]
MSGQSIPPEARLRHLESHYADRVAAFRRQLTALGPDRVLIVLLDIGKNVHWAGAWTAADEELVAPYRLPTSHDGLTRFCQMLDDLIVRHAPRLVLLGHEPTGVYHEPWARALMARYQPHLEGAAFPPFVYRFFNPYQVKLARQQTHLRHRKTDPRDLAAMRDLMLRGLGQPAFLPSGHESLIRQEIGFIRAQGRLLDFLERILRQLLDLLWPGAVVAVNRVRAAHPDLEPPSPIVQTRPLQRERLRILLAHCPNPYDLLAMSDEEILDLYRSHGGRAGPALLSTLRRWGEQAVLLPPEKAAPLADQLQRFFRQYITAESLIEEGRGKLATLIQETSARHIAAIPGLGPLDAAAYLAGLGAAHRFQRAAEVWAFAGFDPIADGSGDHPHRVGHLSKRGDPAFRNALYQMGYRAALHYPPIGLTFLNAFDRGKSEVEATIHAAHRVNRICFHLVQADEPFRDQTTPQMEAEAARRWAAFRQAKKRRGGRRKRGRRR